MDAHHLARERMKAPIVFNLIIIIPFPFYWEMRPLLQKVQYPDKDIVTIVFLWRVCRICSGVKTMGHGTTKDPEFGCVARGAVFRRPHQIQSSKSRCFSLCFATNQRHGKTTNAQQRSLFHHHCWGGGGTDGVLVWVRVHPLKAIIYPHTRNGRGRGIWEYVARLSR